MKVTYPIPNDKVSEYVQEILVIEIDNLINPFYIPVFANGTPTLLFQTSKGHCKNNSNYLTLFGQTVIPEKLLIEKDNTLIAYFLKPYSLYSLFGLPAKKLTDNPIDFNQFSKNTNLQEQLLNAGTVTQMIALLDTYLYSLIIKNTTNECQVKYVTQKIFDNSTKDILTEVRKDIGITQRTFQRIFEKYIGVSPNCFRKINQFSKAFQQLNRKQYGKLSDIAFDNNYADQSHYIRVFKEFTDVTPKEYLNLADKT